MSRAQALPIVKVGLKELEQLLERVETLLAGDDFKFIKELLYGYLLLTKLVRERGTSIARLRRLFGLSGSEKLARVRRDAGDSEPPREPAAEGETRAAPAPASGGTRAATGANDNKDAGVVAESGEPSKSTGETEKEKKKAKGHGRAPASAYLAASHIPVPHASLAQGERCPAEGCSGKVYRLPEPAPFVRVFGQAPLLAIVWDCERWRCGACGKVHTARAPEEAQGPKYDETASSMIIVLHYDAGMPFHRMDQLQGDLETPVPASTQWDVVDGRVETDRPVFDELVRVAAQGSILHNDDSFMRMLPFMGKRRAALLASGKLPDPERTGLFTTAIVSIAEARPAIALFFTGRQHAGENLGDVLDKRSAGLPPPVQMGDALTRNVPKGHAVIEANCLAHGRRKIFDEIDNYPEECRWILEKIGRVYKTDDDCREKKGSAQERLEAHRRDSGPVMDEIRREMDAQLADKRIEPNSSLGEAYNYLLKRWDKFTLFLRVPGAPLDNNICERALKMAIQHRNRSLFYRSERGAGVGDIYMSLLHTTKLAGENPFVYLVALQRNAKAVADSPAEWLPWTYRDTLARRGPKEVGRTSCTGPPNATPPRSPSDALTQPRAA